jgi:hypothetical protein
MAANIRVAPAAHAALSEIARAEAVSLTEALSRAVAAYHRAVFLEGMAREFEALRRDPAAWVDEIGDRTGWDTTLADGLGAEPAHPDARAPTARAAGAPPRRRARRR